MMVEPAYTLKIPPLPCDDGVSIGTIFDHKDRVLRTLNYIESHLAGRLTLNRLARVVCLSPYHFHRCFSHYVGQTVAGYVRTRRLTRAAEALIATNTPITAAAFASGYETAEAFTKAFKRVFGVPPSKFRKLARKTPPIVPPAPHRAILLKPIQGTGNREFSGRRAFGELTRMAAQIDIKEVASVWISLFPDFISAGKVDQGNEISPRMKLDGLEYQVVFPKNRVSFQVLSPAASAVWHANGKVTIYHLAARILPSAVSPNPQKFTRLPIRLRSILCIPH